MADRRVALVTYDGHPEPTDDDRLLADALAERGVHAVPAVWSDDAVCWSAYDAVVVRSCWDYFLRPAEFFAWLDRLETAGTRVFNPAPVLRWNADKAYLRELESRGVPGVPTHWVDPGARESLLDIRRLTGWTELVVKPAISGGAHQTWRTSPGHEAEDDPRLRAMSESGQVLVQPLLGAVTREGEWSLIFFDGAFSHAVRKRPQEGDFRVQIQHGGTFSAVQPPTSLVAQAEAALRAAPVGEAPLLYARVDGCAVDGQLLLMELELLEPSLFFGTSPGAADRLADALVRRLG